MDAVSTRHIDANAGTPEHAWRTWLDARRLPRLLPAALVRADQRAVVVAPHPDDEVLMVGGLLAELAALGRATVLVAVTDGEASHPGSTRWPRDQLARQRTAETALALARLGCSGDVARLGLPDGDVEAHAGALAQRLHRLLRPSDVVFTTWTLDGHPDHEATGRATRAAAQTVGARVYEVPVWGWHWAPAGAAQMPWSTAGLIALSPQALQRKDAALRAFTSQWERDDSCAETPVLRPAILQRAQRPYEVVFG